MITIKDAIPYGIYNVEKYPDHKDEYFKDHHSKCLKQWMIDWTPGPAQNRNFNNRLYNLVPARPLKILDIGCGDGAFIRDCIEDGHQAYGIEGNPYFKEMGVRSWGKFPSNFFITDIGQDFTLVEDNFTAKMDVITSWEFFEHIHPSAVNQMVQNINKHSKIGTWLIFSASQRYDPPGHQNIKNKREWIDTFIPYGFENTTENFGGDVVRNEPDSIICYLRKTKEI